MDVNKNPDELIKDLDTETVTMNDMQNDLQNNPNAMAMDQMEDPKETMSVDAIPDIEKLTDDIVELIDYLETDEAKDLYKNRYGNLQYIIDQRWPDIPYSIVKMILSEEPPEVKSKQMVRLTEILETLAGVKRGESDIKEEFETFREGISEEYIYPNFGGKEEFEKIMSEHVTDKQEGSRKLRRKMARKNRRLNKRGRR
jgi:hypothetical protein